jgi:DtxR family transcriptional regulator, Mn-dependent transcriptional regulator
VASETVENYLKAIHTLCLESPTADAAMTRIAALVGVTTGSATSMVKKLAGAGLVKYHRFAGVRLTARGRRAALDVLRRHRLVETFLVRTLGLDWALVHPEAERLEHAVSPLVLEALDRHLGRPEFDPHGDPIPRADGLIDQPGLVSLATCPAGSRWRLARVGDQREQTLRFLRDRGLVIGVRLEVLAVEPQGQTITFCTPGSPGVTLGLSAAERLLVVPDGSARGGARPASAAGPRRPARRGRDLRG